MFVYTFLYMGICIYIHFFCFFSFPLFSSYCNYCVNEKKICGNIINIKIYYCYLLFSLAVILTSPPTISQQYYKH